MRSALVDNTTNVVTNLIVADPSIDPAPLGYSIIALTDDSPVRVGWNWNGSQFIDPDPRPEV